MAARRSLRVLIADDHHLVRAGIGALLRSAEGVEIAGEAADGLSAVAKASAMRPDVVLMDIAMPGVDGIEATRRIVKEAPGTRVVVLSMHVSEEYVRQAFQAGAIGYVAKDELPTELELAVRTAAAGQRYISPSVSRQVVEEFVGRAPVEDTPRLSPRQREVLQLVGEGLTNKRIAEKLGTSVKTVEAHRAELSRRLNASDGAALVRWAIRLGLVTV